MQREMQTGVARALVVVGHPASGYQQVAGLLENAGMLTAKPGQQHNMAAADISAYLLKRAGISNDEIPPLTKFKPTPLWNSLALDLLLANDPQYVWGWADSYAVHMLDYWYEADPAFHFVLVYDSPARSLVRAYTGQLLDAAALERFKRAWLYYHQALLHFYSRHQERCVLVHAENALAMPKACVQQINTCLQLHLEPSIVVDSTTPPDAQALQLAEAFLTASSELDVYEDLQSLADLPQPETTATPLLDAWNAHTGLIQQFNCLQETLNDREARIQQLEDLTAENQLQLHQVQEELERSHNAHLKTKDALQNMEAQTGLMQNEITVLQAKLQEQDKKINLDLEIDKIRRTKFKEIEEENELLLLQLHQVQEELERSHNAHLKMTDAQQNLEAQNRLLQSETTELQKKLQEQEEKIKLLETNEIIRTDLKEIEEENELLLLQLHQVQEELERVHLENQSLKQGEVLSTVVVPKSAKKSDPVPPKKIKNQYGAADRIKQQLSYRLGSTLIQHSRSLTGILTLPLALKKQVREFNEDKKARVGNKLPPIDHYADAQEAYKVKQHLSYRLGKTLLENYRSPMGWIKLPFVMYKEVRDFKNIRALNNK